MKQLDMTGNPCPIPVVRAKKELENPGSDGVVVLVDNIVAVQNLEKMAKGLGHVFSYEQEGESCYLVSIGKECDYVPDETPRVASAEHDNQRATILITKDQMGSGSEELGCILIKGFIFSLTELPVVPKAVIFLNSGVRLAVEGSNTLMDLQNLAKAGTRILACGTCLNYYELAEKLAVGEVADMFGITSLLAGPGKLITL